MGTVINFNKARKRKLREAADKQAVQNRVQFGRSKADKARDAQDAAEAQRKLDLLKREGPPDDAG